MAHDLELRILALEQEVTSLLGMNAGLLVCLRAAFATIPDNDQLKLNLTTMTEIFAAGPLGQTLSEKQREIAREISDQFLRQGQIVGGLDPLAARPIG